MFVSSIDLQLARKSMIQGQLKPQGITSPDILSAFAKVPRELFLEPHDHGQAYADLDIPVGRSTKRFLMSPRKLAKLFRNVPLTPPPKVLIIGFAMGYSLAIACELNMTVYGVEEDALFHSFTQIALHRYFESMYGNTHFDEYVHLENTPHEVGLLEHAPYDYIIIEGGVEIIPEQVLSQLRHNGQLVSIYLRSPMGIFSMTREGQITHDTFEKIPVLSAFQEKDRFTL